MSPDPSTDPSTDPDAAPPSLSPALTTPTFGRSGGISPALTLARALSV